MMQTEYTTAYDGENLARTLYRVSGEKKKAIAYYDTQTEMLIVDARKIDKRDLPDYLRKFISRGIENKH